MNLSEKNTRKFVVHFCQPCRQAVVNQLSSIPIFFFFFSEPFWNTIVQSTYNLTHAWHFLRGATYNCDDAALQHGPRQLLGVGHVCGSSYCLPHVALPCLLSLVFLALLYMYDVIHCMHVLFLCLAHTGWLWLRVFCWGDWRGGIFQLLMHALALYYCVIMHCTAY